MMGLRHMLPDGRMLAWQRGAAMTTHALALMETLHTVGGKAHIDTLTNQGIGHGIIMVIDFDMIIDVHGGFLPFRIFIGRQR